EQASTGGSSGVFRKPFDARALLAAIGEALRNRKVESEHDC
ncbi:MAG: hypothetical protein K0S65_2623, partial [Labilithrix sp.]|nr:hypothetical protein [Labilithrix sp.]